MGMFCLIILTSSRMFILKFMDADLFLFIRNWFRILIGRQIYLFEIDASVFGMHVEGLFVDNLRSPVIVPAAERHRLSVLFPNPFLVSIN
jgi:hypothetical protein